MDEQI
jgi:hypothetical protein